MTSPPKVNITVNSKDIEQIAYDCLAERKTNPDVLVGVTPELLLAIADRLRDLENAEEMADAAIFDDTFQVDPNSDPN